jgi:hypothetical protein
MGTVGWGVMGTVGWGAVGTADWGVMGNADWTAVGTAYCGATSRQQKLQQEILTVHLTVKLLLTARLPAVCDCLLTERSPRMCLHGGMCRVSVQSDKLLLLLLL